MLEDSALSKRLNSVKSGKLSKIAETPSKDRIREKETPNTDSNIKTTIIGETYRILSILSVSFLYGLGLNFIFSMSGNFLEILGLGFIINHLLTISIKLFFKK